MSYRTRFRRCGSSHFGVGGVTKFLGMLPPWDVDVAVPLEICFSFTCVNVPNLVILGQIIRAQFLRSASKF